MSIVIILSPTYEALVYFIIIILSTGATNVLETTPAIAPNVRFNVLDYASAIFLVVLLWGYVWVLLNYLKKLIGIKM